MTQNLSNLQSIVVHALWCGFATPSTHSNRLTIERTASDAFIATDAISEEVSPLPENLIRELFVELSVKCPSPNAAMFGQSAEDVEWHFGSCTTDDYPQMKVELNFADQSVVLSTESNHVQLLPWKMERSGSLMSFNPALSVAIGKLMPEGFLFRERLLSGTQVWRGETELRRAISEQEKQIESHSGEQLSHEDVKVRLDKFFDEHYEQIAEGEEIAEGTDPRHYTANQLRRLSLEELQQLRAEGFDLSTSDETGQTALMMSAFPPLNREQFEKMVQAGADVDAKRKDGMTGLMLAAAGHMDETAICWLQAGADVHVRGPGNCTALMLGARCFPITSALLDAGADVRALDDDGDSAMEYAMENLSIMRAGSRIRSIERVASNLSVTSTATLERSLLRSKRVARQTRVHNSVLAAFGRRPISENILQSRLQRDETDTLASYASDLDEFIDLEISEIELADRIVTIIEAALLQGKKTNE